MDYLSEVIEMIPDFFQEERVGLFAEGLAFRVTAGDNVLTSLLEIYAINDSYISKTTQNDLIACCGTVISNILVSLVKEAKCYTIHANECFDSPDKEQKALFNIL